MNIFELRRTGRAIQGGFSLIEVLVTMAIVAFGLLGLVGLMVKGLQANSSSSLRTLATAQAYDMADRMRANMAGVLAGNYNAVLPSGSSTSCPVTGSVSPPTSTGSCSDCSVSCSIADVATRDACLWHQANASLLPKGAGAVCKDSANNWYSIYISWDDSKSGVPDKTFILRFEP
jgi:type IV pilus assembly protein PilV